MKDVTTSLEGRTRSQTSQELPNKSNNCNALNFTGRTASEMGQSAPGKVESKSRSCKLPQCGTRLLLLLLRGITTARNTDTVPVLHFRLHSSVRCTRPCQAAVDFLLRMSLPYLHLAAEETPLRLIEAAPTVGRSAEETGERREI
jgi:hypothetical protein